MSIWPFFKSVSAIVPTWNDIGQWRKVALPMPLKTICSHIVAGILPGRISSGTVDKWGSGLKDEKGEEIVAVHNDVLLCLCQANGIWGHNRALDAVTCNQIHVSLSRWYMCMQGGDLVCCYQLHTTLYLVFLTEIHLPHRSLINNVIGNTEWENIWGYCVLAGAYQACEADKGTCNCIVYMAIQTPKSKHSRQKCHIRHGSTL
jgi:hypothetical protein